MNLNLGKIFTGWRNYLLIVIFGGLLFFPYLGAVHLFDWDEINFAEAAREMIETSDYNTVRIDYVPFHEKPPLFIWMQALSMKIFGVNEFAARFPNALTGIITLLILYYFGKKLYDYKFGILWVIIYAGSFLPHFYFKTGIIDPVFNLFIFLGIFFIYRFHKIRLKLPETSGNPYISIILSGFFTGLAVLTKGPVGYGLTIITWLVFLIFYRREIKLPILAFLIYSFISALPFCIWFVSSNTGTGITILYDFINYQIRLLTTEDAGHGGPFYYHFIILLFGCFPASIFMLRGFIKQNNDNIFQKHFRSWMIMLFWIVLIIFSIVKTKIIHYSSLTYYPITYIAAYGIYGILFRNLKWKISTNWLIAIIGFAYSIILILLPLALINVNIILPHITDKFTYELLKANVYWSGFEWLPGLFYMMIIILTLIFFIKKKDITKGLMTLFCGSAVLLFIVMPVLTTRIEKYIQGAPIEFYKSLKNKNCYVNVLGYKSYAHYFYTAKPYNLSAAYFGIPKEELEKRMLTGSIDKDAYFVAKNKDSEKIIEMYPKLKILYIKNGFVFLKRDKD